MKLAVENEDVTMSGDMVQGEFHIKSSAKAFQILSSGLYSDKILAIVRELSCNAYDSHVEAGKLDVPFTVTFPNTLNPEFKIRDYGIGLDHEGVTQVYTTYFESTKQDSNDFIGALGLGSKSPFSYTKNFSVVAFKDGMKRTYSAFVDKNGIPNFVMLDETTTDEPNGVEVKFPVQKSDFYKFQDAGEKVYKWFGEHQPEIKGNRITIKPQKMKHVNIVDGCDIRDTYYGEPLARQGVVVYPMKPNREDIDEDLHGLLDVPFVIDFPVGSLDVAASREELSYIEHTNVNINKRLREIQNGLTKYVKDQLSKSKTDFDKLMAIHNLSDETFKPVLASIDSTSLFKTLQIEKSNYGTPSIVVEKSTLWSISKYNVSTRNHSTGDVKLSRDNDWKPIYGKKDKDGNKTVIGENMRVYAPKATLFLNDTGKRNVLGRVRLHCKDNNISSGDVYVIVAEGKQALKLANDSLGQAPMIKCESLPEPAKYSTSASATTRISLLKLYRKNATQRARSYNDDQWGWESMTSTLVDASKGEDGKTRETLYVPLKNRTVIGPTPLCKEDFFYFIDACVSAGFISSDVVVYGVRRSIIDELTSDYVNLFSHIEKQVRAVSVQKIAANVKRVAVANSAKFTECQLAYLKDQLGDKHTIATIADEAIGASQVTGPEAPNRVHYISRLASELGVDFDISTAEQDARTEGEKMWTDFAEKYPLIPFIYISSKEVDDCTVATTDYIKLVDASA